MAKRPVPDSEEARSRKRAARMTCAIWISVAALAVVVAALVLLDWI